MQTGTRGNPNANILIVGDCYGPEDEQALQPFVGMVGRELDKMLTEAGINPADCYYTNVVNKRPAQNDMTRFFFSNEQVKALKLPSIRGLYPDTAVLEGIGKLEELIQKLQPKLIIALGNYPLWACSESDFGIGSIKGYGGVTYKVPTGMGNYRGSHLQSRWGIPLLPTYHPVSVLRQYPWRYQVVHDLRARVPKALAGKWEDFERNFIIQPTFEQVMQVMSQILMRAELAKSPLLISCDIETSERFIECIGFAWTKVDAICIPIMCHHNREGYWSAFEETEIMLAIKRVLEHPNVSIVGQNFLYDYQYFWWYYNIRPQYRQDTMLAHHVCFPGTPMGLDYISSLYCEYHKYWKADGKEAARNHNDQQRWIYNCRDVVVTYEGITAIWEVIRHYKLQRQYAVQMSRITAAIEMMVRGVRIDEKKRGEELVIHMEAIGDLEEKIDRMLPESVWPRPPKKTLWLRSNQQLAEIMYDVLGQHEIKNFKTGNRTVDDEALARIGVREPLLKPLTEALQQYRSLDVFGQFLNMKVGTDKRMRATFSPTTETFRYRSSADVFGFGRNLQNLPSGNEE